MQDLSYSEFSRDLKKFLCELDNLRNQRKPTLHSTNHGYTPLFDLDTVAEEGGTTTAARGGGLKRKSSQQPSDDDDSEQNTEGRKVAFLAEPGERKKRKRLAKGEKGSGRGKGSRQRRLMNNNDFNNEQLREIAAMGFVEINLDDQHQENPSVPGIDLEVAQRIRSKMTRVGLLRGEELRMVERLFYLGAVPQPSRTNHKIESYRACAGPSLKLFPPPEMKKLADSRAGVSAMGMTKRNTFLNHSIIDGSSLNTIFPVLKRMAHQKVKRKMGCFKVVFPMM